MIPAACLTLAACSTDGRSAVPVEVSDSAGVPRYRLTRLPAWNDEAYLWDLEPESAVPTAGGGVDDAPLVYDPQGYARMPDGTLVVLDNWDERLVVLDPRTREVHARFGPSGQGPGEIRSSNAVLWSADDRSFWVLDPGNVRLSRFSISGRLEEERTVQMAGMGGVTVQRVGSGEPWSWRVFMAESEGLLTDSVGRFDSGTGRVEYVAPMPDRVATWARNTSPIVLFDAMSWFAPVGDGVVVGRNDGGVLRHHAESGELVATLEIPMEQRPIDRMEEAAILEEFYGVARGSRLTSAPAIADAYPLYNFMWQVSDSLFALQQGHRSTPSGEPRIPDGQFVWRVFSLTGEYAGTIVFPEGVALPYLVEPGRITGTHRDALGVATIETYRVSGPG